MATHSLQDVEPHFVPDSVWEYCGVPDEILLFAIEAAADGVPTKIAKLPDVGWVVCDLRKDQPVVWPARL